MGLGIGGGGGGILGKNGGKRGLGYTVSPQYHTEQSVSTAISTYT